MRNVGKLVSVRDFKVQKPGSSGEPELSTEVYARLAGSKDPLHYPLQVKARLDSFGRYYYEATNPHDTDRATFALISGYSVIPVEVVEVEPGSWDPTDLPCEEEE